MGKPGRDLWSSHVHGAGRWWWWLWGLEIRERHSLKNDVHVEEKYELMSPGSWYWGLKDEGGPKFGPRRCWGGTIWETSCMAGPDLNGIHVPSCLVLPRARHSNERGHEERVGTNGTRVRHPI